MKSRPHFKTPTRHLVRIVHFYVMLGGVRSCAFMITREWGRDLMITRKCGQDFMINSD